MCLNGVLVPHRLPHPWTPGRGLGIRGELSRAAVMSCALPSAPRGYSG